MRTCVPAWLPWSRQYVTRGGNEAPGMPRDRGPNQKYYQYPRVNHLAGLAAEGAGQVLDSVDERRQQVVRLTV
jgi:hypothetical protein